MDTYNFILLLCIVSVLDAGTPEFVWLRDLNNDAHKRHFDVGLSEELRFQLNRGHKSIYLHLRENPHIRADTDMYVIQSMPDGTMRTVKETFKEKIENKYYHDMDNSAFFTVRCVKRAEDSCVRTLEGSLRIGDKNFHIAPVSDLNNTDRLYMNVETPGTPHFIQEHRANGRKNKNSDEDIDLNNDYKIAPDDAEEEDIRESHFVRLRRSLDKLNPEKKALDKDKRAPTVYGVELLVAVDPPMWQKFYALAKSNSQDAMKRAREYISQVINGVDLRFKTIQDRNFSIHVTLKKIVVVKTVDEALFANLKPFTKDGVQYINEDYYLPNFTNWVLDTPGMPSMSDYDHAMMITGYTLTRIGGAAYFEGVCNRGRTSLIEHLSNYFMDIMVASHELAHSLGADHDEDVGCSPGNIMWMSFPTSANDYSHKAWEFSQCSIDSFASLLAQKPCVQDKATFENKNEYDSYNRLYPGQIYDPDEQCKFSFGAKSYKCNDTNPENICLDVECYDPKLEYCDRVIPADGTPCGRETKWCIDGQCVSKPSGVTTPKTTSTTTTRTKTTTTILTSVPTTQSNTQPPSCIDICSDRCKTMSELYNDREKFCVELGEECCKTCKEKPKCEDRGYLSWSCATIRTFYSSKSPFCSKWSTYCCASCS